MKNELIHQIQNLEPNLKPEEIFSVILPEITKINLFEVIENYQFLKFHTFLYELGKIPHGIGLGVAFMAQVNISGRILKLGSEKGHSLSSSLLKDVLNGKTSVSLGVSESGWKGRLSNIKSELKKEDDKFYLSGSKGFLTNGLNSGYYIIIARYEDSFVPVLVSSDSGDIQKTPFSMDFAKEATHCRLEFNNLPISKENILPLNYSEYGESMRFSELLSLSYIGLGYLEFLLHKYQGSYDNFEGFEFQKKLDWFLNFLHSVSQKKERDVNVDLEDDFPYGLEILVKEWKSLIRNLDFNEFLGENPDFKMFQFGEETTKIYYLKKLRNLRAKNES